MDEDKQKREAQWDERKKYIYNLKTDLEKLTAAQQFPVTPAGKLITEILEADVNLFANQIASDKFVNDHNGYLDARAKLSYASSLLSRMSRLNDPKKEADVRKKIETAESDQ